MKTKVQKLTACLLTITMLFTFLLTFALPAFAEGTEEFVITATDGVTSLTKGKNGDYEYTSGTLTVHATTPTTIRMKNDVTTTSHIIVIDSTNSEAKVTFDSININTTQKNAVELKGGKSTEFIFKGNNVLKHPTEEKNSYGIKITNTPLKIASKNKGVLNISNSYYAIVDNSSATSPLIISGDIQLNIDNITKNAIWNKNSSVTIEDNPIININATEYSIYGIGVKISGGKFDLKNSKGSILYSGTGEGNDFEITNNAEIKIQKADEGITSKGKLKISDSKIQMYGGDSENKTVAVDENAISSKGLEISGNSDIDIASGVYAISGGATKINDNALVKIGVSTESTSRKAAMNFTGTLDICGNAEVTIIIDGKKVNGFYETAGTYGSGNTVNITDNAKVTIDGGYNSVNVETLNLSKNAMLTVFNDKNCAVKGKTTIADSATLTATSVDSYVLDEDFTVKPKSGQAYMVKNGISEETAQTNYYTEEVTKSLEYDWRYFHASLVDVIPVTITNANKTIKFDENLSYDVSQMFHIDTNAGDVKYSIIADGTTGEGSLDGSELTVTKVGEIKIKVDTAQNGIYLPGSATATLTVLPKQISTDIVLTAPVKYEAPQTSIETDEYTATVAWSPEVTDKFATRTEYTAIITITPKDNYTVAGIAENSYTVDGATSVTNEADSNIITVVFPKTAGSSGSVTATYTVKFDTNGGSTIKNQTVTEYQKAKEPTAPIKDGYTFAGWYSDKELTKAYDFTAKITKNMTLYAKWIVNDEENANDNKEQESNPTTSEWQNPFTDVKADDWFYNAVKYAHQNGLMGGMTTTTFAPNAPLTRGMLVTILYRMEGSPTVTGDMPFSDVNSDAYYHNAILWAVQNNIVSGISATEFAPDVNITREQLAAILQRYAQYKGYDTTQGGMQIREYSDYESISGYALNAMTWAVNSGLLKGKGENNIAPQDTATRAEVAAILQRFIESNK